jgi:predicted secreted protein
MKDYKRMHRSNWPVAPQKETWQQKLLIGMMLAAIITGVFYEWLIQATGGAQ